MIRYTYNSQLNPPAPFVHVNLGRPDGSGAREEWPAQLDTGADQTVLPQRLVESLQLVQLREVLAAGFGGIRINVPTFLVQLAIRLQTPVVVEVLASTGEDFVLLGRDVLNRHRILFDGPQHALEIE